MGRLHVTALFLLSVAAFTLTLALRGETISWSWLAAAGIPSAAVTLVAAFFEREGWTLPFLYGWFVKRPDLRGKWQFTFQSNFEEDGQPVVGKGDYAVTQTWTSVIVKMDAALSRGDHVSAQVENDGDGSFKLCGIFRNEAAMAERPKLGMHYGAYILRCPNERHPKRLEGEYWTDRGTAGSIVAERLP